MIRLLKKPFVSLVISVCVWCSEASFVETLSCFLGSYVGSGLFFHVLRLSVLVIELGVEIGVVVDPRRHHMRVFFVERYVRRLSKRAQLLTVETKLISLQSLISPKDMFSPKIGVRSAFVHGCVRLKGILNVELVLFNSEFGEFGAGVFG